MIIIGSARIAIGSQYVQININWSIIISMDSSIIDLRSDTACKSPQAMLQAMSQASVKNTESLEDVEALSFQSKLATLFGKEAAIFFPTASMANIAAVIAQSHPGSQVIISSSSHAVERTGSSLALLAGVQTRQIFSNSGTFTAQQVKDRIRKEKQHVTFPDTDLIFVENGTFRGRVWDLSKLRQIKKIAEQNNMKVHIDGARIFNALANYQIEAKQISDTFDSMTLCFAKGLTCPFGGAVIGSKQLITKLKNIRKGLGGGLWHPCILTTAANYALEHLLPQIKKDNEMAKLLALGLSKIDKIQIELSEVDINMVFWKPRGQNFNHSHFQEHMKATNIRIRAIDEDTGRYRFLTHRAIRQHQVQATIKAIDNYFQNIVVN